MCEIHPEVLIRAVKSRPALYNKSDAKYNSHNKYKSKIWKDVCREVFPGFDQLSPAQKVEYDLELQKRWKSLRTCFTRELALQKKEMNRKNDPEDDYCPFKKRKKYEYFDALSFLLNPDDVDVTINEEANNDSEDDSNDPLDKEIKIENLFYPGASKSRNVAEIEIRPDEQQYPFYDRQFERPHAESRVIEEKILDLLKDKKKEDDDEDRQFMLSLVPGFKKLNDKQKFDAKIEILKALRKVSFENDQTADNN